MFAMAQSLDPTMDRVLGLSNYLDQLKELDTLAAHFKNEDPSKALRYAKKAVEIAESYNVDSSIARAYTKRAKIYKQLTEYDKAEADLQVALKLYSKLDMKSWLSSVHTDIGILHYVKGSYDLALTEFLTSLKISEQIKDKSGQASLLNNIGNIYLLQENNDKAIVYYQKAYDLNEELGDKQRCALTLDNIGLCYLNKGDFDLAIMYQMGALKIVETLNNKQLLSETLMNVGALHQQLGKYPAALNYFERAYNISLEIDSKYSAAACLINIGDNYRLEGNFERALENTQKAYDISKEMGAKGNEQKAAFNMYEIYASKKDFQKALEFYKLYSEIKDSVFSDESKSQINELSAKYEADKRESEIDNLTKDKKTQKMVNIALYIGIGLVIIMLSLVYYRYREKRKANTLLEEKNIAINEQKELVTEKNKEITDSINYARKIQDAMLPSQKVLNEYFKDNFIFYQPKDIISGDFYWALRKEDKLFVAAADCTGHGVPGALMSMIGVTFLRQIVNEMNITDTAQILNKLHELVLNALNEDVSTRNSKDGMDIALLKIDLLNKKAQFTGAVRPLYIASKSGFEVIKGERFSIGGIKAMDESFSSIEIDLKGGKSFYMFSDGYADQFGQASGKKFMVKKLQELLEKNSTLPMSEQHQNISGAFNNWKGTLEQTDDVLVVGIRV